MTSRTDSTSQLNASLDPSGDPSGLLENPLSIPKDILSPFEIRWNHPYESQTERDLHRLAILRDLAREIHTRRSSLLAHAKTEEAGAYRHWESKITALRDLQSNDLPLTEFIDSDLENAKRRTRIIPEALFTAIEKEKFERYDREWEAALAAEACAAGWRFWYCDAWVQISKAEEFHKALSETLIPHGIVLFAETAVEGNKPKSSSTPSEIDHEHPELWHGQWLSILAPRYQTPDFKLIDLPGVSLVPSSPSWKHLFSPKTL